MKTLKDGQEKIQEICDVLKKETLEPAQVEANAIVEDARKRAEGVVHEAELRAKKMVEEAQKNIEQQRNVFQTSLEQAAVQGLEALRQSIEKSLFNEELSKIIEEQVTDPAVIAKLITAIVDAIEKEGIRSDISALVPKNVSKDDVNHLLGEKMLKRLQKESVAIGSFPGGAKVQLVDDKITIDITDSALKELLATYLRKDFRKLIFGN